MLCLEKTGAVLVPTAKVLKKEEHSFLLEGERIIEAARHEAELLREEAKAEYERQRQAGFEKGQEEGKAEIAGRRDAMVRAKRLLDEVGLSDRGHHYPSQLAGGEQQRVAIARALANDPPIVLADEPTGNLDSTTGRHIMDLLLDVRRTRNSTRVLVTHDADLASLVDSRLTLRDGRPVQPEVAR